MVKKARQQEKQGTAPNSQTFQVQMIKVLPDKQVDSGAAEC